mgnify:CR=1 FL=1
MATHGLRSVILFSRPDSASMLIRQVLIENFNWQELYNEEENQSVISDGTVIGITTDSHHVYMTEEEIKKLEADLIIVASSHRSEKGVKSLHAHSTGNWGQEAKLGGKPNRLSYTMAGAIGAGFRKLFEAASEEPKLENWLISLEVTHHGPLSPTPLIFIEYGGPEDALLSHEAAIAVAQACISAAKSSPSNKPTIGIGGNHYAPLFTKLTLDNQFDFGHIMPKYAMPTSRKMLLEAIEKVIEKPKMAIVDWKGIPGNYRSEIINELKNLEIEIIIEK